MTVSVNQTVGVAIAAADAAVLNAKGIWAADARCAQPGDVEPGVVTLVNGDGSYSAAVSLPSHVPHVAAVTSAQAAVAPAAPAKKRAFA